MFNSIRKKIQQLSIKKKIAPNRKVKLIGINNAKSVALLFELVDETSIETIEILRNEFKKQQIKTTVLAYSDKKTVPPVLENSLQSVAVVTKKMQNFWGIPKTQVIDSFWRETPDMFIDLSLNPGFLSQYISAGSHSSFKIGMHTKENIPYYDFLVKLDHNEQPLTLQKYIQYIFDCLKTIT